MNRILLLTFLLVVSCQSSVDLNQETELIRAQIALVSEAHFKKDAELFYAPNADSWIDIRNGDITTVIKENQIPSTQTYLDQMEFLQMEHIGDPIIEISNDASLASYSSRVLVRGNYNKSPLFFVVSWQNTLRKTNDEWKIISAANTEANPDVAAKVILDQMRKQLGAVKNIASIYAMAACEGPDGNPFSTLIMSRESDGKMEQLSGDRHTIFKHGDTAWGINVKSEKVYDTLDVELRVFAQSHELHWLSLWPETRYANSKFEGIVNFKGVQAFKVSFVNEASRPISFYYDFESYRPLAFDIQIDDDGNIVTTSFNNWETIDNVQMFKKAVFDQGGLLFRYNYLDIKVNSLSTNDFDERVARILN